MRQQPGAGAGAQEASVAGGNCAAREEGQRRASVEPVPCLLPGLHVDVAGDVVPPGPGSLGLLAFVFGLLDLARLAAELRPKCRFCSF